MIKPTWLKCPHKRPAVCAVYTITDPSGNVYVGSSDNVYVRWVHHGWHLRHQKHGSPSLQAAADLYGEHNLVFDVVDQVPKAALRQAEQRLIDKLAAEGRVLLNRNRAQAVVVIKESSHVRGTHTKTGHVVEFLSITESEHHGFNSGAVSAAIRSVYNVNSRNPMGTNVYKGYSWAKMIDKSLNGTQTHV